MPFSTERAIDEVIAADEEGFVTMLVDFAHAYGATARRDHQIFADPFRNGRIPGVQGDLPRGARPAWTRTVRRARRRVPTL